MTTAEKAIQFLAEELKAAYQAKAIISAQLHDAREEIARLNARIQELESQKSDADKPQKSHK